VVAITAVVVAVVLLKQDLIILVLQLLVEQVLT
jgi:hypothetical protein